MSLEMPQRRSLSPHPSCVALRVEDFDRDVRRAEVGAIEIGVGSNTTRSHGVSPSAV
jgi:hypothetical protein